MNILKSFLFLIALSLIAPVYAQTLIGQVEYTVNSAREVSFSNVQKRININEFKKDLRDPMYYNNVLRCIRSNISYDDFNRPRKIVPFYKDGKLDFYGIQYTDSKDKKYYYSPEGNLLKYEINTSDGTYPYKTISYDTNGRILTINLAVSENEAYVFYKNKKLIGHWLNDKCYNENGKVDLTRTLGK